MKKNHSPGGARIGMRMLIYAVAFIAVIGIRETLTDGTGPISRNLGTLYNKTLMAASKLGLGVALLSHDKDGENSIIGQGSTMLGKASHRGYVSAAKVDLFAR